MSKQSKVILGIIIAIILVFLIFIPFFYNNDDTPKNNDTTQTTDTTKDDKTNDTNTNTPTSPGMGNTFTQKDLNDEFIMGLAWMNNSGEFEALCYQTFNAARVSLDLLLATDPTDKMAIVLDVDETVLSNIPYFNGLIDTENTFDEDVWAKWIKTEKAAPLPGAVEFLEYVDSKGISIYYITNRIAANGLVQPTINNLKNFNFPQADEDHVILRTEEHSKEKRRQNVMKDHKIIMLFGDNLEDFDQVFEGELNKARREDVAKNKMEFGRKFFVLPNLLYGSFEGGFAEGYSKFTPEEKHNARLKTFSAWAQ